MATTTLTVNPQKITVPANTDEHEINFSGITRTSSSATALIKRISGTSVQFNAIGAITSDSAALQSDDDRMYLPIKFGTNIRYKGGAGGEVFSITIVA